MSRIFFVRHGQASFMKSDYDQLSPKGHDQAKHLGTYWKSTGIELDQTYSGLLKRQIETAEGCLLGMDTMMDITKLYGYDEHEGPGIVKGYYPERFHMNKEIDPSEFEQRRKEFYGTYFKLAIPWVKGELDEDKLEGIESWSSFRKRFRESFYDTLEKCPSGANIAIFTSGGPVGASVGEALGLDDEKTLQLGWQVKNASFTEFLYSKGKLSLVSFNETPHLNSADLHTLV